MPRDVIEIPLDEIGIICNADAREEGEGAVVLKRSDTKEVIKRTLNYAVYSKNVDPVAPKGRLQPIKKHLQTTSNPNLSTGAIDEKIVRNPYWIAKTDGKYTLVYDNGTTIEAIEDFYGTQSSPTVGLAYDLNCAVQNNQELHIGTGNDPTDYPQWIGYVNNYIFGGIGPIAYTGTAGGNQSLKAGGLYTGATDAVYEIDIDGIAAPDTFRWRKDSGAWTNGVSCSSSTAIPIGTEGLVITFGAETGHVDGNTWTVTVYAKTTALKCGDARLVTNQGTSNGQFNLTTTKNGETNTGVDALPFASTRYPEYAFAVEYDGYQIGPLSTVVDPGIQAGYGVTSISVNIVAKAAGSANVTAFNRRITGLLLFRRLRTAVVDYSAETIEVTRYDEQGNDRGTVTETIVYRPTGVSTEVPKEFFRMIRRIDINEVSSLSSSLGWYPYTDENDKIIVTTDDDPRVAGVSYNDISGLSESFTTAALNYALSCQLNNYHFVAKAYNAQLKDFGGNVLFRSVLGAYDSFNWSKDILPLPFVPSQIVSFKERIYAFGDNKILKINPDLYIEETYDGIGIVPNLKPLVNDKGMFWFDKGGIYMHDGSQILDIGYPIHKSVDETNLKSFTNTLLAGAVAGTGYPTIVYSSEKKGVVFTYAGSTTLDAWFYSLEKFEWYYWVLFTGDGTAYPVWNGKDGEIYFNDQTGTETYKLFASTDTYLAMTLATKKYDYGLQNQAKKFYKARYTGNATVTYGVDDAAYTSLTTAINGTTFKLNAIEKARNIQFKIASSESTTLYYLDTLEIVLRRMVGMR